MRARDILRIVNAKCLEWIFISLSCLLLLPPPTLAQSDAVKRIEAKASEKEISKVGEAEAADAQRRTFAISLVISLATEARSYSDLALRPRVLARAADVLWDADTTAARALFRRAWEAAEKGDTEEATIKTKDKPPAMVMALRRMSGNDLRSEVVSIAARHDRALGEEFLAKLKSENERETGDSKSKQGPGDNWSAPEAAAKRLQVAGKLLHDGQTERALEFAAPALDQVNATSIGFLSELRAREPAGADRIFASLLARTELDPAADANTVSGLSSYAFTPGLYVCFWADGQSTWTQPDEPLTPPNLPAPLLNRFFQVAASILLRPLPPPDQDFTSSGRTGKYKVVKRLLPLFDQYSPNTSAGLRAQLTALTSDSAKDASNNESSLLTEGIKPEDNAGDVLAKMQDRLDHAKTSRERDEICAAAAVTLATQGDMRAREVADKIGDSDRRTQVRQYVDFEFVQRAIRKKDAAETTRLARTGQLTHTQRAWAYTQAARLLLDSQGERALQLLQDATEEVGRIDGNAPDRAVLLVGVARQFLTADRVRAWETMGAAVKAANLAEDFTGENVLQSAMFTRGGVKFISIGGEDFSLSGVFQALAKDELDRSADLAKSFQNDAPRAAATLAIASGILEKQVANNSK
jgi:hypothetical protein